MHDLIIIGAGPAGYFAAEKAGKAGLSTLLFEKNAIGGVCLNEGCIPSKTLLKCASLYHAAKSSEKFGVLSDNVRFDIGVAMARKQKVVDTLKNGIAFTLKKHKVEIIAQSAVLAGKNENGFIVKTRDAEYCAKRLLLCTGSEAVVPPIPGIDRDFVYTNKKVLEVSSVPSKFVVIGGGVIGLELATFFAEIGSAVSVVEMLPHIGGNLDKELGFSLKRELEKKGITFYLQSKVTSIGEGTVSFETEGNVKSIDADVVLVSVGRRPVTAGLGLETLGIACNKAAIITDVKGRTNVEGVWAAGDVNGNSMLAHTAYREAQVCIQDMLGRDGSIDYGSIPSVIYTHPEVAGVGLTKDDAAAQGIECVELKLPMGYSGRYLAETDNERGMAKVVVHAVDRRILGVHLMGGYCSEMIFGAAAMVANKQTVADVSNMVFPHPTVSEIIKDTIMQ